LSINWQLDADPAPALLVLPPDAASLDEAHEAIELWEHYSRKTADPTQRLVVEVMMAQRPNGMWAAATTGREMPRQNGKGDEVEIVELWGLVQRAEAILHTIHDAVLLASNTQERMVRILESHNDLRRLVKRKWTGTGQQMIEMRNGGIIWYRTRTGGGGRGVDDISRLVIDEAQHATEEQLAAMTPTLLANANPQMNVLGTAGLDGRSEWWWRIRRRALSGEPGQFGYVGHTAEKVSLGPDGLVVQNQPDVEDRDAWRACNPALTAGRGRGMAFLEEQYANLGPAMFAQEHLCVWAPPIEGGVARPIQLTVWDALTDPTAVPTSNLSLAVCVSPDKAWASLGIAGRTDTGLLAVGWLAHESGTAWIVERCETEWKARKIPIRVHKSGPENYLIDALRERRIDVVEVSSGELAKSTGQLIDAVSSGSLVHTGQKSLRRSIEGAVLRLSSDGAAVWSQRNSSIEITPLQAVTVAAGGVKTPTKSSVFMAFT